MNDNQRPRDPWEIGIDIQACNRAEAITLLAQALIDIVEGTEECSMHDCDDEPWMPYMWFISRNINQYNIIEKCKNKERQIDMEELSFEEYQISSNVYRKINDIIQEVNSINRVLEEILERLKSLEKVSDRCTDPLLSRKEDNSSAIKAAINDKVFKPPPNKIINRVIKDQKDRDVKKAWDKKELKNEDY